MEYIKTYEGFFDFLRKKDSEDDKIALTFINRLKKVRGISPYDIERTFEVHGDAGYFTKYAVVFDDLILVVKQAEFTRPYPNGVKYRYNVIVECTGDFEKVKCQDKYERTLFTLIESVYKKDIESRRIDKIKSEINPSADLID